MNDAEHPEDERPEREDHLAYMSEASLRITETLDLNTVLQGVVDGTRSLTDARHASVSLQQPSLGQMVQNGRERDHRLL